MSFDSDLHIKPNQRLFFSPSLGMDEESLTKDIQDNYGNHLAQDEGCTSGYYVYSSVATALRHRLFSSMKKTKHAYSATQCKQTYYLSMEYLMGRALGNAALNMGISDVLRQTLYQMGIDFEEVASLEHDAGLGNGGLGRLAACFLDSCATLQLPVTGYGIRYEYGLFNQEIRDGRQVELADEWLKHGNSWELQRPEFSQRIKFGGYTEHYTNKEGRFKVKWTSNQDIIAVPYDYPIPGYQNGTVNKLRLWNAAATNEFNLAQFNAGSFLKAVAEKNEAENISRVLYPNDHSYSGKELRLKQQYFLVSASLQDIVAYWVARYGQNFDNFADKNCFQLNDTHPSIAVAELMRIFVDEYGLDWENAWDITTQTMAYTNHTLLPEALEKWPVTLMANLLPRLMEIIYEINAHFLSLVANKWPGDVERLARMSILEELPEKQIRMSHLAIVGSFSVNGVAELHSNLLKKNLFHDFYQLWPAKFNNKTNGVTQRRWLRWSNPTLSSLISERIGEEWIVDLRQLQKLIPYTQDKEFTQRWMQVKKENKRKLAKYIFNQVGVEFDTEALFDVQVKRIHEYKRQLLNLLHIIHLYDRVKRKDTHGLVKRCMLFGGKAAPGYEIAKDIIKMIHNVAQVVNNDPDMDDWLKIAFLPNYGVSSMELIAPATDLSEQISTAGKEASGTGNMKFMLNGAVTIGTYDGANIEILEQVGEDYFFVFGHHESEIATVLQTTSPSEIIQSDDDIKRVFDLINSGHFNQFEPGIFDRIMAGVTAADDPWITVADFRSYIDAQQQVSSAYSDNERWAKMSIMNTAHSGVFSTDRTIHQYNNEIWKLDQVAIPSDS